MLDTNVPHSNIQQISKMSPYANIRQHHNVNFLIESINQMNHIRTAAQRIFPNNFALQSAFIFLKLKSNFTAPAISPNNFYGNSQYFNVHPANSNQ